MTQLDDFNRVAAVNAGVVIQVHSAQTEMLQLRRKLGARERTLAATTAAAGRTVTELEQLHADRVAYLAQLTSERSLDTAQIARLNAEANAAVVRSETLAAPAEPDVVEPTASPVAAGDHLLGHPHLTVSRDRLRPPGQNLDGAARRLGNRGRRSVGDPARNPHRRPGLRRRRRRRHRLGGRRGDDRSLVPQPRQADAWGRRTVTIDLE